MPPRATFCQFLSSHSSERVAELNAERRQLVGQLESLLQHMQSVKQAQESEQRAATARGGTVLDDVKALEERILSWCVAAVGVGTSTVVCGEGDAACTEC